MPNKKKHENKCDKLSVNGFCCFIHFAFNFVPIYNYVLYWTILSISDHAQCSFHLNRTMERSDGERKTTRIMERAPSDLVIRYK